MWFVKSWRKLQEACHAVETNREEKKNNWRHGDTIRVFVTAAWPYEWSTDTERD